MQPAKKLLEYGDPYILSVGQNYGMQWVRKRLWGCGNYGGLLGTLRSCTERLYSALYQG